jgi:hypothetical protein
MAEYIKRNAIKARLEDLVDWCQDLRKPGLEQALAMLNEEPVADVAPVVRCKDCKHEFGGICIICGFQKRKPEDFCSYGERKDKADAEG